MITHRNRFGHLILPTTLGVFVMMIFVLIVIVAGAALYTQAISYTTATATTHVTIAFVGNTSPIAGIDHVSVAGICTYDAASSSSSSSSRNIEQKIITVSWGDGVSSQSKITRIPSSSSYVEGKWGPLYHKYDSATNNSDLSRIFGKI